MTRDFSKQQRDDLQPPSRNTPQRNYNDEHISKSTRPRLSRDAVDRAWENGAVRQHADYHPRQTTSRPSFQQQGRPAPQSERFQQNRPNYNSRQEPQRGPSSQYRSYQQRSESFEPSQRPDIQRGGPSANYRGYQQRTNTTGRPEGPTSNYRGGYQQRSQANERPDYQRGPSANYRGSQQSSQNSQRFPRPGGQAPGGRPSFNNDRRPGEASNTSSYPRNGADRFRGGTANTPRQNSYRSEANNESGQFGRNNRDSTRGRYNNAPESPAPRDAYNPRWQSRPGTQRSYRPSQPGSPNNRPETEHFEGDYERFNTPEPTGQSDISSSEKHVTLLPDGHVLKGSRPSQRKQERFWNEIAEESKEVMPSDLPTPASEQTQSPLKPAQPVQKVAIEGEKKKRSSGKNKIVKTVRTARPEGRTARPEGRTARPEGRNARPEGRTARAKASKRSTPSEKIIHPSQRGYQWPTAGEE